MKFTVLIFSLVAVVLGNEDYEAAKRRAMQNPDLYDGDMAGMDGLFDPERNAEPRQQYRWPGAQVPYVIDISLEAETGAIMNAFKNYHDNTCVRFVPRTNERDYVRIFSGQGCYSHVGRTGSQQPLSLGYGCEDVGTIVHELGHVLGFFHEHSRSDRDNYIDIYMENVVSGMENNFNKLSPSQNILYSVFDYDSIMIYDSYSFSKNNRPTMWAKNGQKLTNAYEKSGMTRSDIQRVRKMYNC